MIPGERAQAENEVGRLYMKLINAILQQILNFVLYHHYSTVTEQGSGIILP